MNRVSEVNSIDDKRFIFNNEQNQINLTYGQIDNTRRRAFYWGNPITKLAELEDLNDSFIKGFGVDIKTFIKIITDGFYYIKDKEIYWCNNAIFIGNGYCPHSSNMVRTHYLHSETDSNTDKILKDQHYWDWAKEEDVFCFEDYNKSWSIDRKILEDNMNTKIEDYIIENEEWKEPDIICPYCKHKHENEDSEFLYTEKEDYEFECENCGRTFLLTSGFDWWYTTTPIEKEIKNILGDGEDE